MDRILVLPELNSFFHYFTVFLLVSASDFSGTFRLRIAERIVDNFRVDLAGFGSVFRFGFGTVDWFRD